MNTKFECSYVQGKYDKERLTYMDEVSLPSSSMIWARDIYHDVGVQTVLDANQIFREIDAVLLSLATEAAEAQVAAPLQALAPASSVDRQRAADVDGHFRDLMMRCELMLQSIFMDTKFEFGYVQSKDGKEKLIYLDEIGTSDFYMIEAGDIHRASGKVVKKPKRGLPPAAAQALPGPDILLNKDRVKGHKALAKYNALPISVPMDVSRTCCDIAEKITDKPLQKCGNPREEIIDEGRPGDSGNRRAPYVPMRQSRPRSLGREGAVGARGGLAEGLPGRPEVRRQRVSTSMSCARRCQN